MLEYQVINRQSFCFEYRIFDARRTHFVSERGDDDTRDNREN